LAQPRNRLGSYDWPVALAAGLVSFCVLLGIGTYPEFQVTWFFYWLIANITVCAIFYWLTSCSSTIVIFLIPVAGWFGFWAVAQFLK
jgi:hypothetical protein